MPHSDNDEDKHVKNNGNNKMKSRSRSPSPNKDSDSSSDSRERQLKKLNDRSRSGTPEKQEESFEKFKSERGSSERDVRRKNSSKSKSPIRSRSPSKKLKSKHSRSRSRHRSSSRTRTTKSSRSRRSPSRSPRRSPKHSPRHSPRRTSRRSRSRSPYKRYGSPPRRNRGDRSPSGNDYRRPRSRSDSPDGYRLHVAELDVDVRKQELEDCFEQFGELKEVWMARNPPCFAFVVFKSSRAADKALREADGMILGHRQIKVTEARPRARGANRGFRGSYDPNLRCYQCGEHGHFSRNCTDTKFGYKRPPTPPRARRGGGGGGGDGGGGGGGGGGGDVSPRRRSRSPRRRDDKYRERYY